MDSEAPILLLCPFFLWASTFCFVSFRTVTVCFLEWVWYHWNSVLQQLNFQLRSVGWCPSSIKHWMTKIRFWGPATSSVSKTKERWHQHLFTCLIRGRIKQNRKPERQLENLKVTFVRTSFLLITLVERISTNSGTGSRFHRILQCWYQKGCLTNSILSLLLISLSRFLLCTRRLLIYAHYTSKTKLTSFFHLPGLYLFLENNPISANKQVTEEDEHPNHGESKKRKGRQS